MKTDHIVHDDIKRASERKYKQNKQNYNLQPKQNNHQHTAEQKI